MTISSTGRNHSSPKTGSLGGAGIAVGGIRVGVGGSGVLVGGSLVKVGEIGEDVWASCVFVEVASEESGTASGSDPNVGPHPVR